MIDCHVANADQSRATLAHTAVTCLHSMPPVRGPHRLPRRQAALWLPCLSLPHACAALRGSYAATMEPGGLPAAIHHLTAPLYTTAGDVYVPDSAQPRPLGMPSLQLAPWPRLSTTSPPAPAARSLPAPCPLPARPPFPLCSWLLDLRSERGLLALFSQPLLRRRLCPRLSTLAGLAALSRLPFVPPTSGFHAFASCSTHARAGGPSGGEPGGGASLVTA